MRLAARAARKRRCSVGSISTARTSSLRAERFASRARVRRPAFSSAAAARVASSGGMEPSSSSCSVAAWSRWYARISTSSSPGRLVQPLRHLQVELGTGCLREPGVGDVANQDVLEAIGLLARDRGAVLAGEKVALQQAVEDGIELADVGRQVADGAFPEDPSDHRGALQQPLLVPGQPVDARGDDRLQGVRDPLRGGAALEQHPRRLFDEERVALGLLQQHRALGVRELVIGEQRIEKLFALLRRERLELDRSRTQAPSAPAGTDVEELRPREADDQQGCVLDALGEVLDQLEQRVLGPVDVFEHEDQRLGIGQLGGPFVRRPGDLLLAALGFDPLEHAHGEGEQVGHRVVTATGAELGHGFVDRVVVRDPGRDLDHLCEGPVRDALAVRERAAGENCRAFHAVRELTREAALADARLAVDREEMRATVADHASKRVVQQLELVLAADEARRYRLDAPVVLGDALELPHGERIVEPLQLEEAALLGVHDRQRQPARKRADQDLPGLGDLLEPRSDVDCLAGCERRVGLVRHDLPRFDPDPRFEAETVDGVEDRHSGADGALGVVLVRRRNPERRHDGVAGELLDDAPVRGDALRDVLEVGVDAAANDLGVARGDELGRADEIDEEHGCELAFHSVIVVTRSLSPRRAPDASASVSPCSIPASSRPTTFAASTRPSWTKRARTQSAAPTWSTSNRAGSRSDATCGSRRPRCRPH